ncbi:MAG: hypothetical protein WC209_01280 [Ignavibacteriaceae bacterium]
MEFESINTLVNEKQLKTMGSIIEVLTQKLPHLIVTPFKYGKIGNEILVSFKVNQELYQFLIEKLTINGIQVVVQDEKTKKLVDSAKTQIKETGTGRMMPWGNKQKPRDSEKKSIEELSEAGDYTEVIRISRDITHGKEESERAKLNIDRAIHSAINKAYSEAYSKRLDIQKNIDRLVQIASDNNLQVLQKVDFAKQAGLLAVQICIKNKDYVASLIPICNNNKLHNLICVKAAIAFYEIVFRDRDSYREEVGIARKKLNTRWLMIAINTVEPELTQSEKASFNALIDFISANR